jgi:hypothetical protein
MLNAVSAPLNDRRTHRWLSGAETTGFRGAKIPFAHSFLNFTFVSLF